MTNNPSPGEATTTDHAPTEPPSGFEVGPDAPSAATTTEAVSGS